MAGGFAEDLIAELARFRPLLVAAQNPRFVYQGKEVDLRRVGRELGARYVLDGSIRADDERVRVTIRPMDVATRRARHPSSRRFGLGLVSYSAEEERHQAVEVLGEAPKASMGLEEHVCEAFDLCSAGPERGARAGGGGDPARGCRILGRGPGCVPVRGVGGRARSLRRSAARSR